MDYALWLNRHKIRTAAEIADYPDIASLRGYFLAGTLVDWLYEHGGKHLAKQLEKLSRDDPDLTDKLSSVFGADLSECKRFGSGQPEQAHTVSSSFFPESSGFSAASGSYNAGSFGYAEISSFGSFLRTWEFSSGSFLSGSYSFGSGMHEWEWEWLYNLYKSGSFALGSFTSFHEWEWLFRVMRSGSFAGGSFGMSSFFHFLAFGSWTFGSTGSLRAPIPAFPETLDEYDRIMLETLIKCPLDRFGYGIHNI